MNVSLHLLGLSSSVAVGLAPVSFLTVGAKADTIISFTGDLAFRVFWLMHVSPGGASQYVHSTKADGFACACAVHCVSQRRYFGVRNHRRQPIWHGRSWYGVISTNRSRHRSVG